MSVCQAFTTTPDVAARLLLPSMRPLTIACLDVTRAQRVVEEFRTMGDMNEKAQSELAERWRRGGDGEFLKELLRAAGREQPAMDEV